MRNNKLISIYTQDDINTILNQRSSLHDRRNNDLELVATAFAQHTGLATTDKLHPEKSAHFTEVWLANKGELHDTVMTYQTDDHGRRTFADRQVDTPTVGVMPVFANDNKVFGALTTPHGPILNTSHSAPRYPQSPVDATTTADLDRNLALPYKLGFRSVGTYTAPDTGRPMPCYQWHGAYYVKHTNTAGDTAWFRCDPIAVTPLSGNRLGVKNVLFAAPFSNRQIFRSRSQGAMANDELNFTNFLLGGFAEHIFLPELIKSATFGLSPRKLSRLNIATRTTEQTDDLTR